MKKLVKYIGMDVHKAMTMIVVLDAAGQTLAQATIQTQAATILAFIRGLDGVLYVTLEESTYSAWLYDLLSPHVAKVVICDPRKNASYFKSGNKSDRIDAYMTSTVPTKRRSSPMSKEKWLISVGLGRDVSSIHER